VIGLDTNVIVRYIVQDDAIQSKKATTLFESLSSETPGFITTVAIIELVWVLQGCYGSTRGEIAEVLDRLTRTKNIIIEQHASVRQALQTFTNSKADFSDCLIERFSHAAHCEYTVTFDRGASKYTGMRLLE